MTQPLRLLLVEDSEDDALLLQSELEMGGYLPDVLRVETEAAYRDALHHAWDIIIADYTLPHFSGLAALQILHETALDYPLVMVSGKRGEETAVEVMRAGAHDYLLKGNLNRLTQVVARELREYHERRQRRRAEEALRESQHFVQRVIEASPNILYIYDLITRTNVYINREIHDVLGYTPGQVQAMGTNMISTLIHPDDLIRVNAHHAAFANAENGEMREIEYRMQRIDGSWRWLVSREVVFTREDGVPRQILGAASDITDRKEAEEALQEQQAFLREVIDTVPNFIGVKDRDGRFVLANKALAEVYGVTPEAIIGKTDADYNPNQDEVDWFRRDDLEVMDTKQPKVIPLEKVTDSQGRVRWLSTIKVPLLGKDGSSDRVLLTTHDITARKAAEDSLERERAFLTSAIELLAFPIIFNTPEGEVLRANQASYTFFDGLEPAHWWDTVLMTSDTRTVVPRDDWPMMRAALGEVVPATEGIVQLPDGREVPVLAYAAPIYVGERLVATVVAFQDITALKESDRAKDRFLSVLSHELRTPLSNILGWVKEAQMDAEIVPQALDIIRRNAESQSRMLENLLEVSRLLHGKLRLQRQSTELWAQAKEAVARLRAVADSRRITVEMRPPAVSLPVRADIRRLQEVLDNLLDNAVKYTNPGGQVTVTGMREGNIARVIVSDTGRGMTDEQMHDLFRLFAVPQEVDAAEGLRLGLALSANIIDLLGGRLTAASPGPGQGSTFTVELPVEESE
jgi:PAS domain S-box-containing protein